MSATLPIKKRRRRRSGTASWHMSRQAVTIKVADIYKMESRECLEFLVQARFGGWNTVRCPACGTISSRHRYRPTERRWKCRACDRTFSVTSASMFADRKIALQDLIAGALMWVNSAAGQPALELKRHGNTTYNTPFVIQHKLREALMRAYNVGLLNGDIEIDGAHQSGWRADEKRGRPKSQPLPPVDEITDQGVLDEWMDLSAPGEKLPKNRRQFMTIRKRSGIEGYGAISSRVGIGFSESKRVVESLITDFIAVPESDLNSDSANAYIDVGDRFRNHRAVEHKTHLVGPKGENNNQAEELNGRYDRAEGGIYLNIEPKYMLDYGCEMAWRSDTRRLPNGAQLRGLLNLALSVGISKYWVGYRQGKHRSFELSRPTPMPYESSGPSKGAHPISAMNGRPPR